MKYQESNSLSRFLRLSLSSFPSISLLLCFRSPPPLFSLPPPPFSPSHALSPVPISVCLSVCLSLCLSLSVCLSLSRSSAPSVTSLPLLPSLSQLSKSLIHCSCHTSLCVGKVWRKWKLGERRKRQQEVQRKQERKTNKTKANKKGVEGAGGRRIGQNSWWVREAYKAIFWPPYALTLPPLSENPELGKVIAWGPQQITFHSIGFLKRGGKIPPK